jgi:hypothetical protein
MTPYYETACVNTLMVANLRKLLKLCKHDNNIIPSGPKASTTSKATGLLPKTSKSLVPPKISKNQGNFNNQKYADNNLFSTSFNSLYQS